SPPPQLSRSRAWAGCGTCASWSPRAASVSCGWTTASTPTSQSQGAATTPTSCSWTAASTPKFADLTAPRCWRAFWAGYLATCRTNVRICRCDTRSHLARELADWRAGYVGRVVPGACSCPAPPCRALPVTVGCGAQGKAQGSAVPSGGSQVRGRPDG